MFIKNLQGMDIPVYKCNVIIGEWLVNEKSIPVLSIKDKKWYFSKTPLLEEVLESMPLYLRMLQIF